MKKYGLNELREMFLSFFEEKEHLRLSSFPLIPQDDPSLLLINSGMAPMKPWFTGAMEPPSKRVCTCQKCIRTGDIDNVGKTSRHATYFEMLGNFSFGDYFKKDAIAWCWEFLTERAGLDPNRLYPSVFYDDDEAFEIWKNDIGIAPERIAKLGREDNFWDHGSGPCGPCSEVYYDRGADVGCCQVDCAPGCDCDRFIEIWNNVFTQFDNDGANNYSELSQKNIDTGTGLERLACVCQGVDNLFEVDTVVSIINKISEISGTTYGASYDTDVSIRIITDHIRSSTMMICDGVLPSNEGRGYVLRRLLRRAARHWRILGIKDAYLSNLCGIVIDENKEAYPDLIDKAYYITRVVRVEEDNFGKTIDSGMAILTDMIEGHKKRGENTLSGADAFKLYDTYGFPLDLTVEILEERGFAVDNNAFDELMEQQRVRARKAREALGDLAWAGIDLGLDNTPTEFVDDGSINAQILAIVTQEERVSSIREGDEGIIVLDKTPFYAEAGGQSADFGKIIRDDAVFEVQGVRAKDGKYLHSGKMTSGSLNVEDSITASIDIERRRGLMRAHTATHILHKILRSVLGDHVQQAGSYLEPDKVRFDFTHFSAPTHDEMTEVVRRVNEAILDGYEVCISEMPIAEAKKLGAAALFGEKYGDIVRVVRIGGDFSTELCGGTHLDISSKIGTFIVATEFSVASGVRRIEALTGKATLKALLAAREHLNKLAAMTKATAPEDIAVKLEQNKLAFGELRAKLDAALIRESREEALKILTGSKDIGGIKTIAVRIDDADVDIDKLKQIEDMLRDMEPAVAAVLVVVKADKITLLAACGRETVAKGIYAGELIKEITKICGGSGGGKPEFAMGGARDASKLHDAIPAVEEYIMRKLGVSSFN